jgi:tRNA threonylcarbamoyl adenosine modification protein YeaZ
MKGALRMRILALEFSSPQRSVAVVQAPSPRGSAPTTRNVVAEVVASREVPNTQFQTQLPTLELVETALREAQIEREQIDCVAVGIGPGSYTGIRAAIALAQGWQLGRDVKILGVSSAECIAAQAQADGRTGAVAVVIDAQRNEFYLARYEVSSTERREIEPLRLATQAEVQARGAEGCVIIGPEVKAWFSEGRTVHPRAAMVGQMASMRTDFVSGEKLEPIYLREISFVKAAPPRVLPK